MESLEKENVKLREEVEQHMVKTEELRREIDIMKSEELQLKKQMEEALWQVKCST